MSMGDKSNIIDKAETLLFKIWLDELIRTYWERNWAYNDELFTVKYEMQSEWHDSSMKVDDRIYLKGILQLEVSS